VIMRDIISALPYAQGYSNSKGIMPARRAVLIRPRTRGRLPRVRRRRRLSRQRTSELIQMTLQALLDNGDHVLWKSKITDRTKALAVINPSKPTGAVYTGEILEQTVDLARKHRLLILADETYDKFSMTTPSNRDGVGGAGPADADVPRLAFASRLSQGGININPVATEVRTTRRVRVMSGRFSINFQIQRP
jgi:aspartate/methionine/tyrosine aminotransferase